MKKDINQVNICILYEGKSYKSVDSLKDDVAANIIGGSMSSRLFQEIREKRSCILCIHI